MKTEAPPARHEKTGEPFQAVRFFVGIGVSDPDALTLTHFTDARASERILFSVALGCMTSHTFSIGGW